MRICEQNWDDVVWPDGQDYGRQLRGTVDAETGAYTIRSNYILGWLRVGDEPLPAAPVRVK